MSNKPRNNDKLISKVIKSIDDQITKESLIGKEYPAANEISLLLDKLHHAQIKLDEQNQELKISYEKLEAERLKLASFFDLVPTGYLILNQFALLEEINQTALNMLKISREEIIGKKFQNYIVSDEAEIFHQFLYKLQLSPVKQHCELKIKLPGNHIIYTLAEGKAIGQKENKLLKYYITLTDVTKNRLSSQNLINTKERLQMTLTASATGIWELDVNLNRFFMDDFSYALMEAQPWGFNNTCDSFLNLVFEEDRPLINKSIRDAIYLEKEIDIEFRIKKKDNSFKHLAARGHLVKLYEDTQHISGILMDVTEKKKLQTEAKALQLNQHRLLLDVEFRAQEKERRKISEVLHDGICQYLYGVRLNLQTIPTPSYTMPFEKITQLLDRAERELRSISYELNPSVLNDFGFVEGVKELAQRLSAPPLFTIHAEVSKKAEELPKDIQLPVFRIIQELINNTIKHAEASKVIINVCLKNGEVNLSVRDNGKGFDKNQVLKKGSGLRAIENRVFMLNGHINIQCSTISGTYVYISFNVNDTAAALGAI